MAAVGHQRAGKNSRWIVAGTTIRAKSWSVTWRGDDLDTTNMESQGEEQGTIGVNVREWQGAFDWDAQQNAYDSPPGLYPRDDLGLVKMYESVSDNVFWSIATNRVLSAANSAEVKGLVQFNASGKSNGPGAATAPTGSV